MLDFDGGKNHTFVEWNGENKLMQKLEAFITKYYKNLLLKGTIYFITSSLLFFLFVSFAEHFGNFGTTIRTIFFWSFISLTFFVLWKWVIIPLKGLYRIGNTLSQEDAAKIIGTHFTEVEDKLLNLLQLSSLQNSDNELIKASVQQKSNLLGPIPFLKAINFSENKQHLKYALVPISVCFYYFSVVIKGLLRKVPLELFRTTLILSRRHLSFILENNHLQGVKGEDFLLKMHFEGKKFQAKPLLLLKGTSIV